MTEQQEQYEIIEAEAVSLGTIQARGPGGVIEEASAIATQLAEIVNKRELYSTISGKRYVRVEGWTTLGAMLGVLPREVETHRTENGWESVVELVRANDGQVIGRGSAICTRDERNWSNRDDYAVRSMAITRATGKAFRLGFSWVMTLAGYEATPAEEMDYQPEPRQSRQPERGSDDTLNFGKYKGKTWAWVLANHRDYLEWLAENSDYQPTLEKVNELLSGEPQREPKPETPTDITNTGGNGAGGDVDAPQATQTRTGPQEYWHVYHHDGPKEAGVPQKYASNIAKKYGEEGDWSKAISRLRDAEIETKEGNGND